MLPVNAAKALTARARWPITFRYGPKCVAGQSVLQVFAGFNVQVRCFSWVLILESFRNRIEPNSMRRFQSWGVALLFTIGLGAHAEEFPDTWTWDNP